MEALGTFRIEDNGNGSYRLLVHRRDAWELIGTLKGERAVRLFLDAVHDVKEAANVV